MTEVAAFLAGVLATVGALAVAGIVWMVLMSKGSSQ